eukprot:36901-Eustigmatos_ZCMA.PRE.1
MNVSYNLGDGRYCRTLFFSRGGHTTHDDFIPLQPQKHGRLKVRSIVATATSRQTRIAIVEDNGR